MDDIKNNSFDQLCIDNIRSIVAEMIDEAKSGHPGMAIGAAPILHTLYTRFLKATPENPNWINRDRFILSGGHASSLLYAVLHLSGYNLTIEDLKKFRSLGSLTPGHPEVHVTDGVDAATGPLGQGIAQGVGMAISEEHLRSMYPELIDHYTYVLCGDGDMQEGITQEAFSLAGHLNLNKLIVLYDSNDIQLDGYVNCTNTENSKMKYEGMGWNYQLVKDGSSCDEIAKAIKKAKSSKKPTIIEIKTIIGETTSLAGTNKVHGAPLPHEEVVRLRNQLKTKKFEIDDVCYGFYFEHFIKPNNLKYKKWTKQNKTALLEVNDLFKPLDIASLNKLIPTFEDKDIPTRKVGSKMLSIIGDLMPSVIGGSADLASSVMTKLNSDFFTKDNRSGRNIAFGVREHLMASVCNGMCLYGLRAFCSTFFVFADYLKPAIRMAALSNLPTVFIFSHDSIAVGEDGPTHQPVEQLTMLRSIPNIDVIRPSDLHETISAYKYAFSKTTSPTVIVLSRQALPVLEETKDNNLEKGAYIVSKEAKPQADGIIIATGSEVSLALKVKEELLKNNIDIRVVSMPSTNLFDRTSEKYQEEILPSSITKIMALEMSDAAHMYKYVGKFGLVYNITSFGVSAPASVVVNHFKFNVESIKEAFLKMPDVDLIRYIK